MEELLPQKQNPLEAFTPTGNEFFDSRIIAKMNQHTLFWKEEKNSDSINLSLPKKLDREIDILKFLSGLYSSMKKSGKTYEEYIKGIPDFENKI